MTHMMATSKLISRGNVRQNVEESIQDLLPLIEAEGIKNPILVYSVCGQKKGTYVVKEGHRRLACAKALGFTTVPVTIVEPPKDEVDAIAEQYIINMSQRPLNYLETAKVFQDLKDHGMKQVEIARKFQVSEAEVSLALSTLRATPKLQQAINEGRIEPSAVEPLLPLSEDLQNELADAAIRVKTARKVRELVSAKKLELSLGEQKALAKKSQVPEDADPLEALTISTLDEALSILRSAVDQPVQHPSLKAKGRSTVKELLRTAKNIEKMLA